MRRFHPRRLQDRRTERRIHHRVLDRVHRDGAGASRTAHHAAVDGCHPSGSVGSERAA
jgi:hypothetical protein